MFEWKEAPLKKPFNSIGHISDWDGTLRTHKALHALRRFRPNSAGEIARIWMEERFPLVNVEDVEFPMFLEDPNLTAFVDANLPPEDAQWRNWYITRWDLTDSVADMWTFSPELHEAYPTRDRWFNGVNIGKGWQELLLQVRTILDRYSLSGASLGAIRFSKTLPLKERSSLFPSPEEVSEALLEFWGGRDEIAQVIKNYLAAIPYRRGLKTIDIESLGNGHTRADLVDSLFEFLKISKEALAANTVSEDAAFSMASHILDTAARSIELPGLPGHFALLPVSREPLMMLSFKAYRPGR